LTGHLPHKSITFGYDSAYNEVTPGDQSVAGLATDTANTFASSFGLLQKLDCRISEIQSTVDHVDKRTYQMQESIKEISDQIMAMQDQMRQWMQHSHSHPQSPSPPSTPPILAPLSPAASPPPQPVPTVEYLGGALSPPSPIVFAWLSQDSVTLSNDILKLHDEIEAEVAQIQPQAEPAYNLLQHIRRRIKSMVVSKVQFQVLYH
jgi:hypothetical protein